MAFVKALETDNSPHVLDVDAAVLGSVTEIKTPADLHLKYR